MENSLVEKEQHCSPKHRFILRLIPHHQIHITGRVQENYFCFACTSYLFFMSQLSIICDITLPFILGLCFLIFLYYQSLLSQFSVKRKKKILKSHGEKQQVLHPLLNLFFSWGVADSVSDLMMSHFCLINKHGFYWCVCSNKTRS